MKLWRDTGTLKLFSAYNTKKNGIIQSNHLCLYKNLNIFRILNTLEAKITVIYLTSVYKKPRFSPFFNVKGSPSRKRTDKVEEAQSNIGPSQQEYFKWNPLVDAKYDDWIFILLS